MYITHANATDAREWAVETNASKCCVIYPRKVQPEVVVLAEVAWGQNPRAFDMRPADLCEERTQLFSEMCRMDAMAPYYSGTLHPAVLADASAMDARFVR